MRRSLSFVCITLLAAHLQADPLAATRAAVVRLVPAVPVRATFATEQKVKSSGRFANENATRAAAVQVTHDGNGVSIIFPQALLDKVAQDVRSPDPNTAGWDVIGQIRSVDVVESVDFRDRFLAMIENASVVSEQRVVFRGRAARLLELKLNPRPRRESGTIRIGSVKSDDRMRLWVGDDHLPVAAERTTKTTGGFMFLQGTHASESRYTFGHTADRFFLARVETSDRGSGMGQNIERSAVQTLTFQ